MKINANKNKWIFEKKQLNNDENSKLKKQILFNLNLLTPDNFDNIKKRYFKFS